MDLAQMLGILQQQSGRGLTDEQRDVVGYGDGPLWVIAGPGSGKTEVLVLRCLKLTCVDLVSPRSIILTTFTEKAAKNIQDRLAIYKSYLEQAEPSLRAIDLFQLRVGTLHSLCNDILQEYRFAGYQNYRLLDEIDQLLFTYEQSVLAASSDRSPVSQYLPFWQRFSYLAEKYNAVAGYKWTRAAQYLPHRWVRANATMQLFNRIVEDRIDVMRMRAQRGAFQIAADAYADYRTRLEANLTCDFAHLQEKFLDFLATPNGARFLDGEGTAEQPGIAHVLVDEYQDTNPIQEEIYLQLASRSPHNICVVGDDDQALYRFRGGTVEAMVNFDLACQRAWGPISVLPQPLSTNFRSLQGVITWCNDYVLSFPVMTLPNARVANKPQLQADPAWRSVREQQGASIPDYASVSYLQAASTPLLADRFAELVRSLLDTGTIRDASQCVLLMKSTRVTKSGVFQRALEQRGIPVYNPRSRTFLEQEEVQCALGALISVVDPNEVGVQDLRTSSIQNTIRQWLSTYRTASSAALQAYVAASANRISQTPPGQTVMQASSGGPTRIPASIQEIFYHTLSFEPFNTWQDDPARTMRLGRLSKLLEAYSALPFPGVTGSTRGNLRTDSQQAGRIASGQLSHLYYSLIGLLVSEGVNDPEDEEVISPLGYFPIMTVHQAKGLQFPFVFVVGLGVAGAPVREEYRLEEELAAFRVNPAMSTFDAQERADQDYIRFFFVAYSRAEYALVLLTTTKEVRSLGLGFGGYNFQWFASRVQQLM